MNAVQNKETSPVFTPFAIKLEQICNVMQVVSVCVRESKPIKELKE